MSEPGIAITRVFGAPRERLWREWTEPERFADWYGGADAEIPLATVTMDVRPGGRWKLTMRFGPREIHWHGEYREVVPPERLVFTVSDRPGEVAEELVIVDVTDLGDGRTEMRFQQRGGGLSPDGYERAKSGWGTFFDHVDARLLAPQDPSPPPG
jgi:uncharacterized protein YndB with AHSA1/START domain